MNTKKTSERLEFILLWIVTFISLAALVIQIMQYKQTCDLYNTTKSENIALKSLLKELQN